jgi:DnaJ-class molecular chaperone
MKECPVCEGKGYKIIKKIDGEGIFKRVPCDKCGGKGTLPSVFKLGMDET